MLPEVEEEVKVIPLDIAPAASLSPVRETGVISPGLGFEDAMLSN